MLSCIRYSFIIFLLSLVKHINIKSQPITVKNTFTKLNQQLLIVHVHLNRDKKIYILHIF